MEVLKVKNIEKYYGSRSNLTLYVYLLALVYKKGNLLELWGQVVVEKLHY